MANVGPVRQDGFKSLWNPADPSGLTLAQWNVWHWPNGMAGFGQDCQGGLHGWNSVDPSGHFKMIWNDGEGQI